jgi:hypothetical protein
MAFTSMCRMMIAVSAVVLHLWPGDARAQEYEASNLTLKKSYIKSDFDVLPLHAGSAALFTPTTVSCPGAGTCLIRVEITEQILGLDSEAELRNCIRVDGSFSGVFPNGCVRHNYVATLQNKTLTLTLAWVGASDRGNASDRSENGRRGRHRRLDGHRPPPYDPGP